MSLFNWEEMLLLDAAFPGTINQGQLDAIEKAFHMRLERFVQHALGNELNEETGLPHHLPMPVNRDGDGPTDFADTFRVTCWCLDETCTWKQAMRTQRIVTYMHIIKYLRKAPDGTAADAADAMETKTNVVVNAERKAGNPWVM